MSCTLTRMRLPPRWTLPSEDVADVQLAPDRLHVDRLAFVGERRIARDHDGPSDPRDVGRQALRDPVDEMLLLRVASDIGERQHHDREAGRTRVARRGGGRRGHRLSGLADLKRIDSDRLGNVLQLREAEIGDGNVEPRLHLPVGVFR